jgi:hypothetical protein
MIRHLAFLALLLFQVWLTQGSTRADDKVKKAAHEQATQCQEALLKGDYVKVIDRTLPTLLDKLGGRLKALAQLRQGVEQMKSKGYTITSIKVSAPSQLARAGTDLVVILPMVVSIKGPKATVIQKSFLVGASKDKGRKWSFLDGAGLTDDNITDFIANWPDKVKLPAKERPTVQKN